MDGSDPTTAPRPTRNAKTAVAVVLVVATLYFAPLAISVIEYTTFGTDHFEDWARKIGIHEPIEKAYAPIKHILRLLQ